MATTAVAPDRVFVDTNVLVYATLPASPFHVGASAKLNDLDSAGAELWISRQILREFLAAMTRPGVAVPMPAPADVYSAAVAFTSRFLIADDTAAVFSRLVALLGNIHCGGRQVYDANIVATMLAHGIPNLLTHNTADFQRFAGHVAVTPLVP